MSVRLIGGNPGQHKNLTDGVSERLRSGVAEHLRTSEEMAAYLDAGLDEAPDDAAGLAKQLGSIARAKGMTKPWV